MNTQASHSRLFVRCLLGLLVISFVAIAVTYWKIYGFTKLFGDFDTFQKAAVALVEGHMSAVYDVARVQGLFDAKDIKDFAFYLNPPTGLFILFPLGLMGHTAGLVFWTLAQLGLLLIVLRTDYMRRLFDANDAQATATQPLLIISFLAFCLQSILFGQVAVLCSVLFFLVLIWRKDHPVCAGLVLGIFSFKPQLGLLLPVLLLAEKNWKVLIYAAAMTLVMIALSFLFWGEGLWQDYAHMMTIRSKFMATSPDMLFIISTSPYAALRNLGLPATPAFIAQGALALATIAILWPVLRRGEEWQKILMLTLGIYFVTPYSLIYDMVLLAIPTAMLLRHAEAGKAERGELIALLFLILTPVAGLLLQIFHIPYCVIAIGFALSVAKGLTKTEKHG